MLDVRASTFYEWHAAEAPHMGDRGIFIVFSRMFCASLQMDTRVKVVTQQIWYQYAGNEESILKQSS